MSRRHLPNVWMGWMGWRIPQPVWTQTGHKHCQFNFAVHNSSLQDYHPRLPTPHFILIRHHHHSISDTTSRFRPTTYQPGNPQTSCRTPQTDFGLRESKKKRQAKIPRLALSKPTCPRPTHTLHSCLISHFLLPHPIPNIIAPLVRTYSAYQPHEIPERSQKSSPARAL